MYIYICIYVCMCVCIYKYIYIYVYTYIFGTSLEMTSSPILVDCSKRFTVLTLYTACMFPPCNAHWRFHRKDHRAVLGHLLHFVSGTRTLVDMLRRRKLIVQQQIQHRTVRHENMFGKKVVSLHWQSNNVIKMVAGPNGSLPSQNQDSLNCIANQSLFQPFAGMGRTAELCILMQTTRFLFWSLF